MRAVDTPQEVTITTIKKSASDITAAARSSNQWYRNPFMTRHSMPGLITLASWISPVITTYPNII